MAYQANVYNVMLASPSDVDEERKAAREIILDWNNINALSRKIVLLPLGWEYNSVPTMGDRPQEIINKQVLKNADLLVGIFWTRIGTPTGKALSGSVEEIEEHIKLEKPAMLYFSKKPVMPDSIDPEQYNAVKDLKREYQGKGLTETFDSLEDFKIKFQRHLSLKLNGSEYFEGFINSGLVESYLNSIEQVQEVRELSKEAKILLIEASQDPNGTIMKLSFIGGFTFQTNGKRLNEDFSARTRAKWEAAIKELLDEELIVDTGYKGEIFTITQKGYALIDELKDVNQ